jgi:cytochrome c peroxidase
LGAIARWTLAYADMAVRDGSKMLTPEEGRIRTERIQAIGREIQELGRDLNAPPTYADFESRLQALQEFGFHPDGRLVSAVAQAIGRGL